MTVPTADRLARFAELSQAISESIHQTDSAPRAADYVLAHTKNHVLFVSALASALLDVTGSAEAWEAALQNTITRVMDYGRGMNTEETS